MRKNYLLKQLNRLFTIFLISSILLSCQEDNNDLNIAFQANGNAVSEDLAYEIAENLVNQSSDYYFETSTLKGENAKKIKSVKTIKTKKLENAFYIVNYEPNGFALISADKRMDPILAYSEDNTFPTENGYPENLQYWMDFTVKQIEDIKNNNLKQSDDVKRLWVNTVIYPDDEGVDDGGGIDDGGDDDGGGCSYTSSIKVYGPYIITKWGQYLGYNNYCPTLSELGCTNGVYGSRAKTGCIATAMSQVMRYHEYPENYNWNIMPNFSIYVPPYDTPGYNEISRLMYDAGDAVDMDYQCLRSGAKTYKVAPALNNSFNYTDAKFGDFVAYVARRDIIKGRPFIFHGGDHAWVCHGMRILSYTYESCYGTIYYQYYMDWGADGLYEGYYIKGRFNPGDNDFNDHLEMTYNIYK